MQRQRDVRQADCVTVTTMSYSIRLATYADLGAIIHLYLVGFWDDQLMDILHPYRHKHQADFERFVRDMLTERWWTLGFEEQVDVLITGQGKVIGFAWWRRNWTDRQRRRESEGWLTCRRFTCFAQPPLITNNALGRWLSPVVISLIQLRTGLWPYQCANPAMVGAEKRVLPALLPLLRDPPSRQKAWLLRTLVVNPDVQKEGLGAMLVRHGLSRADKEGLTTWLLSREGLEGWYGRFGFVERGRANIGELSAWNGGAVMFRERESF